MKERDETDVRWFLCDASGELSGVHSANMEPVIGPSTMQRDYDPSARQMRARARERRMSEIFAKMIRMDRMVLALVYGFRIPTADYDRYGSVAALIEFTEASRLHDYRRLSQDVGWDAKREAKAALATAESAYAVAREAYDRAVREAA